MQHLYALIVIRGGPEVWRQKLKRRDVYLVSEKQLIKNKKHSTIMKQLFRVSVEDELHQDVRNGCFYCVSSFESAAEKKTSFRELNVFPSATGPTAAT